MLEYPARYVATPRAYSAKVRFAATGVLVVFLAVGVVTTVYSLGVYCLTTYAGVPFHFTS